MEYYGTLWGHNNIVVKMLSWIEYGDKGHIFFKVHTVDSIFFSCTIHVSKCLFSPRHAKTHFH